MTCNIVCITNGARPRLLEQTLRTLYWNTPSFNLVVVCDGHGGIEGSEGLSDLMAINASVIAITPCNIVGRLKNLGAYWAEKHFGRGEWICFIDDDLCFEPYWLNRMKNAMTANNQLRILGGVRHPYHGVNDKHRYLDVERGVDWDETDAVAGYCHFMRWSTWDKFGPYDANAKGTGQSEDYAICRKVVEAGGAVGYIHPPVMAHCGITDSQGKRILGAELIEQVPGVIYE